jgi:hypothetical protein
VDLDDTREALPHQYVLRAHLFGRCVASRATLLDRVVDRDGAHGS